MISRGQVILVVVIILGLFVCSASSSSLLPTEQKSSKIDISPQKLSKTSQNLTPPKESGVIFFDGKNIMQNSTIMKNAFTNLELLKQQISSENKEDSTAISYKHWTIQDYIDWINADPSYTIGYMVTGTSGAWDSQYTQGVLGYSPATDLLIGDKNEEVWLESYQKHFQTRLMIDPAQNTLIIQRYSNDNETMLQELSMDLLEYDNGNKRIFYGLANNDYQPIYVLYLVPFPHPS